MLNTDTMRGAASTILAADGTVNPNGIELTREWDGDFCRPLLFNHTSEAVRISEIVLFSLPNSFPPETPLYGEGFQMLSQTEGTLGKPADITTYTDRGHYRIPAPSDAATVYGLLAISPSDADQIVIAFSTCYRFAGQFRIRPDSIDVVLDTEDQAIEPGEKWHLEELMFATGSGRSAMLSALTDRIQESFYSLPKPPPPAGWCSWYCFGSKVTAKQVLDNVDFIAANIPELKYIQIDDGYQAAMGDWTETGAAFGGGVQDVLARIREKGFEPALWVAPFVAEENSRVFREHPDWFIKDVQGKPLRSDRVTFGGWRHGPWYALDGTHPGAQKHLETLFRTLWQEWGCTYFKLNANFWGAMHGGRFHDPKATRIEAYRRGMRAIGRGCEYQFLLGCNHPMWASINTINGSRSSNDITRTWESIKQTARENLLRNWQNGKLWWNDPDCVVLTGSLTDDEFTCHASAILASGGMVLSGDDLTAISPERLVMLRKLVPPTGVAAVFEDDTLSVGYIDLPDRRLACLFNWSDEPRTLSFELKQPSAVTDFWTDANLGMREGRLTLEHMPPHSARVLSCRMRTA